MFQKKIKMSGIKMMKTGMWSIIGTFLIKAVNLLSIPVFSRMLNTAEYGDVNLFMTYITIFAVLLGLDFNGTLSKGSVEFKEQRCEYEASSLSFTAGFALVVFLLCNIFEKYVCRMMNMNMTEVNLLIFYSYATFVISYFSADCIFQFKYKKNTALSLLVVLSNFCLSIFLMVTIFSGNRYYGRIIGASIPTIIIAIFIFILIIQKRGTGIRWMYIKYSLKLSVPLIPHHLSGIVLSQADKIMISAMIGKAENGIYSLVYNVGWMLSVLVEALNNVWMPWSFRRLDDNDIDLVKTSSIVYLAGFSLVTIIVEMLSPELVKIIAPKMYWTGIEFVIWVVLAAYVVFLYYFYVNIECFYKKTYLVSLGTVVAAIINVLLNLWGLKRYGFGFAAISTVVSYVLLLIFHFIIVRFIMRKNIISDITVIIFLIIVFVYSLLMQQFLSNLFFRLLIGIVFCGGITVFVVLKKKRNKI